MICKWILPDSSVYYAVTLVSSDAVWLLSHLTVKKGSWVRGMDCAVSALVTQIVQTLQRNKCIFNCGCMEGMWKIHFLRDRWQKGRGYGSSASQSLDAVFFAFVGQRVKWWVCVSHKAAQGESLHNATPLAKAKPSSERVWDGEKKAEKWIWNHLKTQVRKFQCCHLKFFVFYEWKTKN